MNSSEQNDPINHIHHQYHPTVSLSIDSHHPIPYPHFNHNHLRYLINDHLILIYPLYDLYHNATQPQFQIVVVRAIHKGSSNIHTISYFVYLVLNHRCNKYHNNYYNCHNQFLYFQKATTHIF